MTDAEILFNLQLWCEQVREHLDNLAAIEAAEAHAQEIGECVL